MGVTFAPTIRGRRVSQPLDTMEVDQVGKTKSKVFQASAFKQAASLSACHRHSLSLRTRDHNHFHGA